MNTIIFIIGILLFGIGCIKAYHDHVEEKEFYFSGTEPSKFDKFMWNLMGVLKILFVLFVFCGLIRLYFMVE